MSLSKTSFDAWGNLLSAGTRITFTSTVDDYVVQVPAGQFDVLISANLKGYAIIPA
jgi:hypothetical protein